MHYEKAYYIGTHHYSFRCEEAAEIIGVEMIQPKESDDWRACYRVKYADGKEDLCPVAEHANYKIVRAGDVRLSLTQKENAVVSNTGANTKT